MPCCLPTGLSYPGLVAFSGGLPEYDLDMSVRFLSMSSSATSCLTFPAEITFSLGDFFFCFSILFLSRLCCGGVDDTPFIFFVTFLEISLAIINGTPDLLTVCVMRSVLNFSLLPLDLLMTIPLDGLFATLFLRFGLVFLFILNTLLLGLEFWLLTLLLLVVGFDFTFLPLLLVFVCLLLTLSEDNLLVFMVHIW